MPRRSEETVAVRATAPGAGGIAVVEVLGPQALAVVGRHVPVRAGRLVRGRIVDEVLARWAPRFGEPTVEISCHGGPEAVRAVIAALGVREVDRAFVLERAVAARRIDRTRAEAVLLLPGARTERAAFLLADQADGALARAVRRLKRPDSLRRTADLGCALASPPRVAIVGAPNVGKSTLFNALVERDRALVYDRPGSTRDPVEETIAIDGIPIVLVDTAGLATPATALDAAAMERTRREQARAALVLAMDADRRTPWTPRELSAIRRRIVRDLGLGGAIRRGAPAIFTPRQRATLDEARRDWQRRLLWGPP